MSTEKEWLLNEDKKCFNDRLRRLKWLSKSIPSSEYILFHGGFKTKLLFEEARYSFAYGQYLSTIFLGISFLEITLASLFFGFGRNDLEKASITTLLKEALKNGLINDMEFKELETAKKNRNGYIHFRKPFNEDSIEYKSVSNDIPPFDVLENDAKNVLKITVNILDKPFSSF